MDSDSDILDDAIDAWRKCIATPYAIMGVPYNIAQQVIYEKNMRAFDFLCFDPTGICMSLSDLTKYIPDVIHLSYEHDFCVMTLIKKYHKTVVMDRERRERFEYAVTSYIFERGYGELFKFAFWSPDGPRFHQSICTLLDTKTVEGNAYDIMMDQVKKIVKRTTPSSYEEERMEGEYFKFLRNTMCPVMLLDFDTIVSQAAIRSPYFACNIVDFCIRKGMPFNLLGAEKLSWRTRALVAAGDGRCHALKFWMSDQFTSHLGKRGRSHLKYDCVLAIMWSGNMNTLSVIFNSIEELHEWIHNRPSAKIRRMLKVQNFQSIAWMFCSPNGPKLRVPCTIKRDISNVFASRSSTSYINLLYQRGDLELPFEDCMRHCFPNVFEYGVTCNRPLLKYLFLAHNGPRIGQVIDVNAWRDVLGNAVVFLCGNYDRDHEIGLLKDLIACCLETGALCGHLIEDIIFKLNSGEYLKSLAETRWAVTTKERAVNTLQSLRKEMLCTKNAYST